MNLAIFGSCVSRDTCEFLSDTKVLAYTARHSCVTLLRPRDIDPKELSILASDFQRRMVRADLTGSGVLPIAAVADRLDGVLVDLTDERRGYWTFPDGSTMTNSIEAHTCGLTEEAYRRGARLVEFGTDEHYNVWQQGFQELVRQLNAAELLDQTVLLNLEWALHTDAESPSASRLKSMMGRTKRKTQRRLTRAASRYSSGESFGSTLKAFTSDISTRQEKQRFRSKRMNRFYKRYIQIAEQRIPRTISRSSSELRMKSGHRWGAEPFHYRDSDYIGVARELHGIIKVKPPDVDGRVNRSIGENE